LHQLCESKIHARKLLSWSKERQIAKQDLCWG
jgi:hypothetical protein